jgi:signal transduction histidine kinase
VFDRFYRAPGQERRTGAGLGLAIAREIIVAHGGSIACTSEPGRGAEFHFLLPL